MAENKMGGTRQASGPTNLQSIYEQLTKSADMFSYALSVALFGLKDIKSLNNLNRLQPKDSINVQILDVLTSDNNKKGIYQLIDKKLTDVSGAITGLGKAMDGFGVGLQKLSDVLVTNSTNTVAGKGASNANININGISDKGLASLENVAKLKVSTSDPKAPANVKSIIQSLGYIEQLGNSINSAAKNISIKNILSLTAGLNTLAGVFTYINKDLVKLASKIDKDSVELQRAFKTIDSFFDQLEATAKKAENSQKSFKKINNAINNVSDTSKVVNRNSKDIAESIRAIGSLGKFVMLAGLTLIIGAYIMRDPKVAQGAIEFTALLSAFVLAVIGPIVLMSIFTKPQSFMGISGLAKIIFMSAVVMILGALIVQDKKMIDNALNFGVVLGVFILCTVAPLILAIGLTKTGQIGISGLAKLLFSATVLMLVGALFVQDEKYVQDCLRFGTVLGAFIFNIILPLSIFALANSLAKGATVKLTGLLFTLTVIMFIGALFVRDKEYVEDCLKFGTVLGAFIFNILLPIGLFGLAFKLAQGIIKELTWFLFVSTVLLMVGALFIEGGYAVPALEFTGVLALFITGVLAPFVGVALLHADAALVSAAKIGQLILMATVSIAIGAAMLKFWGWGVVVGSAVLIDLFVISVIATFAYAAKSLALLVPAEKAIMSIGICVLALSGAIFIAALAYKIAGGLAEIGAITAGLYLFTRGIISIFAKSAEELSTILTGGQGFMYIAAGVAILAGAIFIAAITYKLTGPELILIAAGLAGFTYLIIEIFSHAAEKLKDILEGGIGIIEMAAGVAILAGAILIAVLASKLAGDPLQLLEIAGILFAFTAGIVAIFSLAAKRLGDITKGAIGIMAIGGGLTLLSSAILIAALAGKIAGGLGNLALIAVGLLAFTGITIGMFYLLSTAIAGITIGGVALLGMAGGLALLSGAILIAVIASKLAGGPEKLAIVAAALLGFVVATGAIFAMAAAMSIGITIGSIALGAMAVSLGLLAAVIIAMTVAIRLWEKVKNTKITGPGSISEFIGKFLNMPTNINFDKKKIRTALDNISEIMGGTGLSRLFNSYGIVNLMADVTRAMKDYAELRIPTSWNDKGVPTSYRLLTKQDFENAATGVKTVLTTLSEAILDVYYVDKEHSKVNDALFGKGMTTMLNKIKAVGRTEAELLSEISEALKSYVELKMADKWDEHGKAISYRQLTETDFRNAAKNVGTVLKTLSLSIIDIYNEDAKAGHQLFPIVHNGIFAKDQKSPIITVIESFKGVGGLIVDVVKGLQAFANGKMPIYGKDGKIVSYERFSDDIGEKAANQVGAVITGFANTIIDIYNSDDFKKAFGNDIEKSPGLLQAALDSVGKVGTVLTNMVKGIEAFAQMKIPIGFDKDGKATGYYQIKDIDKFFNGAKDNIYKIITTMVWGVYNAYEGNPYDKSQRGIRKLLYAVNNMVKPMNNLKTLFTSLIGAVETANKIDFATKKWFTENNGKLEWVNGKYFTAFLLDVGTMLTKVAGDPWFNNDDKQKEKRVALEAALKPAITLVGTIGNTIADVGEKTDNIKKLLNYNAKFGNIEKVKNAGINSGYLQDVYAIIDDICKLYTHVSDQDWIKNQTDGDNPIYTKLKSLATSIKDFITELAEGVKTDTLSTIFKYKGKGTYNNYEGIEKLNIGYFKDIYVIISDCSTLFDSINSVLETANSTEAIAGFKGRLDELNELIIKFNTINETFGDANTYLKLFGNINSVVDKFRILNDNLVGAGVKNNESISELEYRLSLVSKGIIAINNAVSSSKSSGEFNKVTNQVSRFINNSVNKIDLVKIDKLISLTMALNKLAERTTNLDSLTNAIADNLTVTLEYLGNKLDEAKTSIELADQIQDKRHRLINDSIGRIRDIMNSQINVLVTAEGTSGTPGATPGQLGVDGTIPAISPGTGPEINPGNVSPSSSASSSGNRSSKTQTSSSDISTVVASRDNLEKANARGYSSKRVWGLASDGNSTWPIKFTNLG